MWDKDIKKVFGNKKISQISVDSIKRFHKKYAQKPYYANRCIVLIRTIFNLFIKEGTYKGSNPTSGVQLNKEEPRVRYMEHNELERFFSALNESSDSVSKNAIIMMLFTGARRGNVFRMKWDEIDMEAKIWRIPKTKTSKNETIPLADSAVELLEDIQNNNPDEVYVFPSATSKSGHIVDVKSVWNTIKKKANIKNLRLHDLRHTLATYMVAGGMNPFMVQRVLTHKTIKSTQVYVNLGVEHLRGKLNETINTMQKIGKCNKNE
jgi:integrase